MAERRNEAINSIPKSTDVNLPEITASLESLTVDPSLSSPSGSRRVLRKRMPRSDPSEINNRRCSSKPQKRKRSEDDVKEYYLDKSSKRQTHTLETIFEEEADTSETAKYMSVKKYKRMIQFQSTPSLSKVKKRQARIKKVFGSKFIHRRYKTVQSLLDKLSNIQLEPPTSINVE